MSAPPVRMPEADDQPEWLHLRRALWPQCALEQHELEMGTVLADADRAAVFVSPATTPERRGHLAGFVEVAVRAWREGVPGAPVAQVEALYVMPEERDRGVGSALLTAAESWARERGCRAIAADSTVGNDRARALHRHLGYEEGEVRVRLHKVIQNVFQNVTESSLAAEGDRRS